MKPWIHQTRSLYSKASIVLDINKIIELENTSKDYLIYLTDQERISYSTIISSNLFLCFTTFIVVTADSSPDGNSAQFHLKSLSSPSCLAQIVLSKQQKVQFLLTSIPYLKLFFLLQVIYSNKKIILSLCPILKHAFRPFQLDFV